MKYAVLPKCDNETRLYLFEALGNLGRYEVPMMSVALQPLLSFVRGQYTAMVKAKATEGIRWIVRGSRENATAFMACPKGLDAVLALASTSQSETCRCHAVLVLSELCTLLPHVGIAVFEHDQMSLVCAMVNSASVIQRHAGVTLAASMMNMSDPGSVISCPPQSATNDSPSLTTTVAAPQNRVVAALEERGLPARLVQLVSLRTESELTLLASLSVLKCMAFRSATTQQLANDAGAVELLIRMFQQHEDHTGLRLAVAAALSQILRCPAARDVAVRHGLVELYGKLIRDSVEPLRMAASSHTDLEGIVIEALLSLFFMAETKEFRLAIGSMTLDSIGSILYFPYGGACREFLGVTKNR